MYLYSLQDYFVRISHKNNDGENKFLYICVVCWAKLDSSAEMVNHRESCKVNFGDDSNDGEAMDTVDGMVEQVTSVVSTPDIPAMMDDTDTEHPSERMNGTAKTNGSIVIPGSPSFPQPEVILETDVGQPLEPQQNQTDINQGETYSSQCLQCSLCTMVLPSSSYLSHLRTYHRVSCPLTSANCPLCMTSVPIMDLTVHLATQHGLVPQTAVNALLLWVLTSNTFALNDSAQASLKSKFKGQQQQQQQQQHGAHNKSGVQQNTSTPKLKSSLQSFQSHNNNNKRTSNLKAALTSPISQTLPGVFNKPEGPLINDLRGKIGVEQIIGQLTRSHTGPGGKESHQCLVCSKWYAIPPVKHMRSHIATFNKERKRVASLASGASICLICYKVCDSQHAAAAHISTHTTEGLPGGASGGLLAEALLGFPSFSASKAPNKIEPVDVNDDLPLGATFETPGLKLKPAHSPATSLASNNTNTTGAEMMNVELDNAGRVKSGKVRKQCELCGEWSNIKWFFKHMSEVHQALFCRCCREYLPIHEHKEHRQWHQMPPYMGQKIRIEDGQPIIIDRKERASLTPIGSLAAWGGSSGGDNNNSMMTLKSTKMM